MPTSAIVGQARLQISSRHRLVRGVRAAEVQLRRLLDVRAELLQLRAVEPELLRAAPARCSSVRLRPRNRFATGSDSTTRKRKKLKTTTNASVASAPSTLQR